MLVSKASSKKSLAYFASFAALILSGCGVSARDIAGPTGSKGLVINGSVHGGVYPIQGATIRLMETQTNGVWNAATLSYKGTAKQLLTTTSDKNGYFTFPDTGWTCDAGQYAYITVSSGHTLTNATNNNVVQIGVIGGCSTTLANKGQIDNVNVFVSELSTIAAAYTMGSFITIDNTNASTGQQIVNITAPTANSDSTPACTAGTTMTCTAGGLGHAFTNAFNLVDSVKYDGSFPTGTARTTLPTNTAFSVVPQVLINTMGNILQSCVDSPGGAATSSSGSYQSDGSHCGDLFQYATPPSGTAPTNTLQVALNMAHYPTNNVDSLFKLQPRATFFTPTMTTDALSGNSGALMSFTLSVFYLNPNTSTTNPDPIPYPTDVALDSQDNAYITYQQKATGSTYAGLVELGADGTLLGYNQQTTWTTPQSIALDTAGHAWISDDRANGDLYQVATATSGGTYGSALRDINIPNGYPSGVSLDYANNIFVGRDLADTNQSLYRFDGSTFASTTFQTCTTNRRGQTTCTANPPTLTAPVKKLYVDNAQAIYGVAAGTTGAAQVFHFPYEANGAATDMLTANLSTSGGYAFAINSSDQSFYVLKNAINTATGTTTSISTNNNALGSNTSASATSATYGAPMGASLDGAGRLFWSDFESTGQIFMLTPATSGNVAGVTPISFFPCYPINGQCYSSVIANIRGLAVDSSGAMWYLADSTQGVIIETFGLAAASWPLQSYAQAGVPVQ